MVNPSPDPSYDWRPDGVPPPIPVISGIDSKPSRRAMIIKRVTNDESRWESG